MAPFCRFLLSLAVTLPLLGTAELRGETQFWFSTADQLSGSAPPSTEEIPNLTRSVGATNQQLHIWVRPDATETLENFSLNVVSSSPDVIGFTAVEVHNTLTGGERFEFTFDTTNDLNPDPLLQTPCPADFEAPVETALWAIKGYSVTGRGLGVGAASQTIDPRYDATNNSWLLATVHYDVLDLGSTDLYLQIGEVGMNLAGGESTDLDIVFGDTTDTALNARDNHCVESSRADAELTAVAAVEGDFNFNGALDAEDIDLLSAEVQLGLHPIAFDLTADTLVSAPDRTRWVTELANTFFGDANLDGSVAFADFLTLSTAFGGPGGWAQGDFDGDATINFGDFLLLSTSFGMSTAAAVPEPCAWQLLLLGWVAWSQAKRRRRPPLRHRET